MDQNSTVEAGMDFNLVKKRIILALILGVIIVGAIGVYSDLNKLIGQFLRFNLWYLPLILALAPLNYFFRFLRWNYYLRILNIKIGLNDSIRIFAAGLSMAVSPGKAGELIKSFLIKELNGAPVSVTSPVIVAERLTDTISMILLASLGALKFKYGFGVLAVSFMLIILLIAFVRFHTFAQFVIRLLKKIPLLNKAGGQINAFYKSSFELFNIKRILLSIIIGLISWGFEGIVIYLATKAFGFHVSILSSIFTVSFSSIVGAISMIPGGLFVTEGSIIGLLAMTGAPKEIASAVTIVTRLSTLWLGVAVGIAGLLSVQRRLEHRM